MAFLQRARGKPGRHPKPFNVLAYHLIRRYTRRRLGPDRQSLYRADGQFRLRTNWGLTCFMLVRAHVHERALPEIAEFTSHWKGRPAERAMGALKMRLLNIYKNFPPIHGWPMQREGVSRPETGFRKVMVTDDQRLRIIEL